MNDSSMQMAETRSSLLEVVQRLPTSGARSVAIRSDADGVMLAVAQFAKDVAGQPPSMHAGDSNLAAPLYRWTDGQFVECGSLPLPGGEQVEFFEIDGRRFIAGASIRSGRGPYEMDVKCAIYEWIDGARHLLQSFATFGAKQWRHFSIGARHFLALAQGVDAPGLQTRHPRTSRIYEWEGSGFKELQVLEGRWGYGWCPFELDGQFFLAYADHLERSVIYRWTGVRFEQFQVIAGGGGRAFAFFRQADHAWLAFANLQSGVDLYRWDGAAFTAHQHLGGPGARALQVLQTAGGLYLVNLNFIQGTPASPQVLKQSQLYRWAADGFELRDTFATSAATDVAGFQSGGSQYLVVANSLDSDLKFRTDTVVYRFLG
jgi:hypothetical protein